jgi:transcriptional regulator with XRE-family HTH domain
MKLGSVIKYYRIKKQWTQTELSKDICSISHLSKIENDSYDGNVETIDLLLQKLGVDVKLEEEKYLHTKEILSLFFESMVYYDHDEADILYKQLEPEEEFASSTDLINIYHLYMLRYFIFKYNVPEVNTRLTTIQQLKNAFSPFETLMATFFTGISHVIKNEVLEAEKIFLSLMIHNQSEAINFSGELYYQLALCASVLGDSEKTSIYTKKALYYYQEDNNFIRITHTQILLGISYLRLKQFKDAEDIFRAVIRNTKFLNQKELYNQNINNYAVVLKEQQQYGKALELYNQSIKSFNIDSNNYIVCMLLIIEVKIKLKHKKEEIIVLIDKVIQSSQIKKNKKYLLFAQLYKYQLFSQAKYYSFLENKLYPYFKENQYFDELKDYSLMLARHFEEMNDLVKAVYYFNEYTKLSTRGVIQ